MDTDAIKQRIEQEIIGTQYPELIGREPQEVAMGPSESHLRALRRRRVAFTQADVDNLPKEYQFVYRLPETDEQPFSKTIVVVTDQDGGAQYIVESR